MNIEEEEKESKKISLKAALDLKEEIENLEKQNNLLLINFSSKTLFIK